jgi:hypothetical protein
MPNMQREPKEARHPVVAKLLPEPEDTAGRGPAMAALKPSYRAFVEALFDGKTGHGALAAAARAAGFGDGTNSNSDARTGYRLAHRDDIVAAILEHGKKVVRSLAPDAARALAEEVNNVGNPVTRLRAANMILERTDAVVTKIDNHVTVEVIDHAKEAVAELALLKSLHVPHDKLLEHFGYSGLAKYEALLAKEEREKANIVEGEFIEVARDPDEDILGKLS